MSGFSKKSQHFVPKFYLKRFTFDGKYCYTKNRSGKINCQKIDEICKMKNTYEIKDDYGIVINKNFVENKLSELDNYCDKFLIRFLKYIDTVENNDIIKFETGMEKQALMLFFVITLLRNNKVISKTQKMLKEQFNIFANEHKSRNRGIKNIFELSTTWSDKLSKKYSVLIHRNITDKQFITSDIPIHIVMLGNNEFFYMPLSPKYFMVLIPKQPPIEMADMVIENKELDIDFFNSFFSHENCEKVSISNDVNNFPS